MALAERMIGSMQKVRKAFAEKAKDLKRGHSLEEEAVVKRQLNGDVRQDDFEKHLNEITSMYVYMSMAPVTSLGIDSLAPTINLLAINQMFEEMERWESLSEEQKKAEVRNRALEKTKEWKLVETPK